MAVSWMPLTPDARTLLERAGLDAEADEGLSVFPSEHEASGNASRGGFLRRAYGVKMRVAPISRRVAWGVTAIVLLGAVAAVAIGMLAADTAGRPRPVSIGYDARR